MGYENIFNCFLYNTLLAQSYLPAILTVAEVFSFSFLLKVASSSDEPRPLVLFLVFSAAAASILVSIRISFS